MKPYCFLSLMPVLLKEKKKKKKKNTQANKTKHTTGKKHQTLL